MEEWESGANDALFFSLWEVVIVCVICVSGFMSAEENDSSINHNPYKKHLL